MQLACSPNVNESMVPHRNNSLFMCVSAFAVHLMPIASLVRFNSMIVCFVTGTSKLFTLVKEKCAAFAEFFCGLWWMSSAGAVAHRGSIVQGTIPSMMLYTCFASALHGYCSLALFSAI